MTTTATMTTTTRMGPGRTVRATATIKLSASPSRPSSSSSSSSTKLARKASTPCLSSPVSLSLIPPPLPAQRTRTTTARFRQPPPPLGLPGSLIPRMVAPVPRMVVPSPVKQKPSSWASGSRPSRPVSPHTPVTPSPLGTSTPSRGRPAAAPVPSPVTPNRVKVAPRPTPTPRPGTAANNSSPYRSFNSPFATPRRAPVQTKSRPYITPSPRRPVPPPAPVLPVIPQLNFVCATPVREFETPSRKRDSDPTHLGKNWAATPLPLRLSFAERDRRAAEQQASRDLNVINGIWFKRIVEFDLEGPHGGLLTDLVEAATADDALLSTIPKDEFFSIIDEIILALPEEDHPAMHGIVFGYEGNGKDDIEQHTIGQLQEICIVLVEELVLVDGELRLVTDDSVF